MIINGELMSMTARDLPILLTLAAFVSDENLKGQE
jgi:hypothetical protein